MIKRLPLICALLFALAHPASAAFEQTEITSDAMVQEEGAYDYTGSVVMHRADLTMKAAKMHYTLNPEHIDAEGDFFYSDGIVTIKAERAQIDMATGTGTFYNGVVGYTDKPLSIRGAVIHKYAENGYMADKAIITTCTDPKPAWCVVANDADVTVNGWLKAHDATFVTAGGTPVMHTPYLIAPALQDRQSGLLSPVFGYSSQKGVIVIEPVYWAISDNTDATLTLDVYGNIGAGADLEYRYVLPGGLNGRLEFTDIPDWKTGQSYMRTDSWSTWDGGFIHVNRVSRDNFYRLFEDGRDERDSRFLESDAEAAYDAGPVKLFAASSVYQDLSQHARQAVIVNRLPELGAFLSPQALGPITLIAGANAVNFERAEGSHGQRYDGRLRLFDSVGSGLVFSQEAEARGYAYDLEDDGSGHAASDYVAIGQYKATLAATFAKTYDDGVKHYIEPAIEYDLAGRSGDRVPFFDSEDKASDRSVLIASVMNRLRFLDHELDAVIKQPYDLRPADEQFKPLEFDLHYLHDIKGAHPKTETVGLSVKYDYGLAEVTKFAATTRLDYEDYSVGASDSYNLKSAISTQKLDLTYKATPSTTLGTGVAFDRGNGRGPSELYGSVDYHPQCWGIMVSVIRHTNDFTVKVALHILGLGS